MRSAATRSLILPALRQRRMIGSVPPTVAALSFVAARSLHAYSVSTVLPKRYVVKRKQPRSTTMRVG